MLKLAVLRGPGTTKLRLLAKILNRDFDFHHFVTTKFPSWCCLSHTCLLARSHRRLYVPIWVLRWTDLPAVHPVGDISELCLDSFQINSFPWLHRCSCFVADLEDWWTDKSNPSQLFKSGKKQQWRTSHFLKAGTWDASVKQDEFQLNEVSGNVDNLQAYFLVPMLLWLWLRSAEELTASLANCGSALLTTTPISVNRIPCVSATTVKYICK